MILEDYPDLQSQDTIRDAMQQNSYLQREITAARTLYNDAVNTWNREIFEFPFKKIVAAKEGRTTRIPFIAEKEIKNKARGVFFWVAFLGCTKDKRMSAQNLFAYGWGIINYGIVTK